MSFALEQQSLDAQGWLSALASAGSRPPLATCW